MQKKKQDGCCCSKLFVPDTWILSKHIVPILSSLLLPPLAKIVDDYCGVVPVTIHPIKLPGKNVTLLKLFDPVAQKQVTLSQREANGFKFVTTNLRLKPHLFSTGSTSLAQIFSHPFPQWTCWTRFTHKCWKSKEDQVLNFSVVEEKSVIHVAVEGSHVYCDYQMKFTKDVPAKETFVLDFTLKSEKVLYMLQIPGKIIILFQNGHLYSMDYPTQQLPPATLEEIAVLTADKTFNWSDIHFEYSFAMWFVPEYQLLEVLIRDRYYYKLNIPCSAENAAFVHVCSPLRLQLDDSAEEDEE